MQIQTLSPIALETRFVRRVFKTISVGAGPAEEPSGVSPVLIIAHSSFVQQLINLLLQHLAHLMTGF